VREPLIAQIVNPFGSDKEATQIELSWLWIRMAYRLLRFMIRFPRQLPGMLAAYQAEIDLVEEYPYQIADEAEICQQIYRLPFEYANKLLNYDFLMIAVIGRSYRLLGAMLKRFYKADTEEVVAKLISGVTGNITMETNKHLWDLAQIARSDTSIGEILRGNGATQARILLQNSEAGQKFIQAMDQFLDEFGHREVHMDILYPTWCDDPEPVYSFIRSYLDADESQSPYCQQERLSKEREQLTRMVIKDVERSISGRLFLAPIFRWILQKTQIHTRERDTMHFEMTRLFPPLRRLMLELGKRWQERGLLNQNDDIFYLTIDEIMRMPKKLSPMQDTVRVRKDDFLYAQQHACPNIIRNGEEIFAAQAGTEDVGTAGLQGIAGSPGVVTGITRIIKSPDEFTRLKKGEILVAPITNPVWTPLFAVASGVVTEVGGILSHGAIVAREYGIPAVMSVAGVTRLLQDGQRVTVDGNKGLVILEQEA
jgi:pyruvate,water dikinase